MAEIGLASSVIAVIQIVTAVTTQAYNYGLKFKNAKDDVENINRELGQVGQVLEKLKSLAERAEKSAQPLDTLPTLIALAADEGPLATCNQALMDLMTELSPASGVRAKLSQRAKWAWKKDKVEKSLQTIVKQKMAFLELLSVDQMSQAVDIGNTLNKMSEAQIKTKKKQIVKWLSLTDPRTNQEAARKKHEDETGKWFTGGSEYATWLEQPNSFLWLHGIPGCGKTILCSEIIEETTAYCRGRDDHQLAYFFFSFRDAEKQKASNLPRSILAQLLQQAATTPKTLQAFHDEYQHGEPSEKGVMDAIQALITGPHVFIIIDALDECPNTGEERAELCNILEKMHSWGHESLHILVTSRKEADLTNALQPVITQRPIGIQGTVVDTDIRKFVKTQLRTDPKLSKWPPELQTEIEETIVKKSGGMFRWVVCQFHSLSKCLCPSDIRIALSSLPRTLDETYERILVHIPIEYRSKATAALQWIVYSATALSLSQVADAIVVNPKGDPPFSLADRLPDRFWILEVLPGLIIITERELVEIAHFSVVEYLESARIVDGPAKAFRLEKPEANKLILKGCMDVLRSYAHPTNQLLLKDDPRSLFRPFSALETYACRYWDTHVESLKTPIDPEIPSLVLDFALNIKSILHRHYPFPHYVRRDWAYTIATEPCDPLANAFYIASDAGYTNIVTICLDAGADVDTQGKHGTALQAAASKRRQETCRVLLDAGADVNKQGGYHGTALQVAADFSFHLGVEMLLDAGADVNLQGGQYGTALQAAAARGFPLGVKMLLDARADVNIQGGVYGSALQAAAARDNHSGVEMYDARADVNIQGGDYGTALQVAAARDSVVKMFLDAGADVNIQGGMYSTALQAAADRGSHLGVKMLLDAGADVNIQGGMYGSALQAAAAQGSHLIIKMLLDAGADVNIQGGQYGTALQAAAAWGYHSVVKMLLDAGANVNIQGGAYGTALQAAAARGFHSGVEMLLDAGADVNVQGGRYGSALRAARFIGHEETRKLLRSAGAKN